MATAVATKPLRYFSSWFCPFAHRCTIALEHHGVPYDWDEVLPNLKSSCKWCTFDTVLKLLLARVGVDATARDVANMPAHSTPWHAIPLPTRVVGTPTSRSAGSSGNRQGKRISKARIVAMCLVFLPRGRPKLAARA